MINDITVVHPGSNLHLEYADDLTLSILVKSTVPNSLAMQEVGNIQQWAFKKRVKLNLSKTWEMVLRGKTTKQVPDALPSIVRKPELKLFGATFNQDPCNWDTHFDLLLRKASSRLYMIRVFKFYGYLQEELTALSNSLIMSLFLYAIEVWGSTFECNYLSGIDKFRKCGHKYGYLLNYTH